MASSSETTTSQTAPAAASTTINTIELVAQCLCKTHTFTTQIPIHNSDEKQTAGDNLLLPREAIYCHCTSCRRSTGALYSASVVWPGSLTDPHNQQQLSNLRWYKRAAESSSTGLFCPKCSTLLLYEYDYQGSITYGVFLGCLRGYELDSAGIRIRPVMKGLVKAGHHLFVGDTGDGGAVCWMKAWGKQDGVRFWTGHRDYSQEIPLSSPLVEVNGSSSTSSLIPSCKEETGKLEVPEEIAIKCHCGGVNLSLQAGRSRREYLSKIRQGKSDELPWFVNPQNGKMVGTLDGCDSCTNSAGVDLFNWTFAEVKYLAFGPFGFPKPQEEEDKFPTDAAALKKAVEENMVQAQAQAQERHYRGTDEKRGDDNNLETTLPFGTLAFYSSSPDVQRYFCSVCSAAIFYACDDRPEMVDIAVGVLCPLSSSSEASGDGDGARAERIISWPWDRENLGNDGSNRPKTRIGWREDMLGCWKKDIVGAVEGEVERIVNKRAVHVGSRT